MRNSVVLVGFFVILSANPLSIDPLAIADIQVLETINNGQAVYRAPEEHSAPASMARVDSPRVGGDRDSHGCIGSAGYQWCEKRGECARSWELVEAKTGDTAADLAADFADQCSLN